MNDNFSPIEKLCFKGFEFYLKRDDKLGEINGNKARKLAFFLKQNYPKNQRFVSFGGSQSNALAALSIFARDFKLVFACEKISNFLKTNPCGNYALALKNKACIVENLSTLSLKEFALSLCEKGDIFIPEGVACKEAELGYKELAKEIEVQALNSGLEFDIFLPSGTGTSAAFLAKYSKFKVFTKPCVGDSLYLRKQILALEPNFDFNKLCILDLDEKFSFAKPNLKLLNIYQQALKECGVEFDLLYDSLGLLCVLAHQKEFKNPLLYIHQGGILGNESMLSRYQFLGFDV